MNDKPRKKPEELRSQQGFGRQDHGGFAYRSWGTGKGRGKGVPHDQFDGRPVIGICNTFSELTPCNSHFRTLAEQVKIGTYEEGWFPARIPGCVAWRDAAAADCHAVPQPGQHGRGREHPRQPDQRRGAVDGRGHKLGSGTAAMATA